MDALHVGDMDTAYAEVLSTGDDLLLVKLMERSGPIVDQLSNEINDEVLHFIVQCLVEQNLFNLYLSWIQQLADQVMENGPNILGIPTEIKNERLLNLNEASLTMDVPEDWEGATPDQLALAWGIDLQHFEKIFWSPVGSQCVDNGHAMNMYNIIIAKAITNGLKYSLVTRNWGQSNAESPDEGGWHELVTNRYIEYTDAEEEETTIYDFSHKSQILTALAVAFGIELEVEASTNQVAVKQMPIYQLPSKILCRVVDVQLKAEADTDEVFAQVTMLPESNV
ncbi:hypothetical protein GIB67_009069 [Kingdonia uniflora]|uniref:TORTIFOLIA1/TORL1-2 C-terminal domain-containing protein n=1 Tax=Kingdonia uniflora TaxID=39325 RepID=A0A7J7P7G0_9MAGN|nr:hypothetical protein GIB67_009069 [Kingdonia uniflora]